MARQYQKKLICVTCACGCGESFETERSTRPKMYLNKTHQQRAWRKRKSLPSPSPSDSPGKPALVVLPAPIIGRCDRHHLITFDGSCMSCNYEESMRAIRDSLPPLLMLGMGAR